MNSRISCKWPSCCFVLLLILVNTAAQGQAPASNMESFLEPNLEWRLKREFSLRFNIRMSEPALAADGEYPLWREIEYGDYFTYLRLEADSIPECHGLRMVTISLSEPSHVTHPGGHTSAMVYRGTPIRKPTRYFLVGIDQNGGFHYLSGDIFLDSVEEWLQPGAGIAEVAKVRLRCLKVGEVNPVPASPGHFRFEAASAVLKAKVIIDLQDEHRFRIFRKNDETNPILVEGGWTAD